MEKRFTVIEHKIDKIISLLEGSYGSQGLVKKVEKLDGFVMKALATLIVLLPLGTLLISKMIA